MKQRSTSIRATDRRPSTVDRPRSYSREQRQHKYRTGSASDRLQAWRAFIVPEARSAFIAVNLARRMGNASARHSSCKAQSI